MRAQVGGEVRPAGLVELVLALAAIRLRRLQRRVRSLPFPGSLGHLPLRRVGGRGEVAADEPEEEEDA